MKFPKFYQEKKKVSSTHVSPHKHVRHIAQSLKMLRNLRDALRNLAVIQLLAGSRSLKVATSFPEFSVF